MPKQRIVVIPERLAALGDAFEEVLREAERTLDRTDGGKALDYAEVERQVAERVQKVEGTVHQVVLQALDVDVPTVIIGGLLYNRVGRCEDSYHTMVGSVQVERSLYRQAGTRGGTPEGRVVDPVSLRAGVVGDGWLPNTAQAMAHSVQMNTSREAAASAAKMERLPYSRTSFEKVAHIVGAFAVASNKDIEDTLIEAYEIPDEAVSVSVSLDRVSIPIEVPRPRPVGRPRKNAPKRPVAREFKMAYCATVTVHDRAGDSLHTIRYGAMPSAGATEMRDRLVADVATLRSERQDLQIQLLCDGAPEMWNLLEEGFTEQRFGAPVHRLVDFRHLQEKLSAAAKVVQEGDQDPAELYQEWTNRLLKRKDAAKEIADEVIATAKDEGPGDDHPVHALITYLQRHSQNADRMNYAGARRRGLPIGSGNVEATCKSLFGMRFKRCGARWKQETGQHIVQLRAHALSDRWDDAIELTLRPLAIPVREAA